MYKITNRQTDKSIILNASEVATFFKYNDSNKYTTETQKSYTKSESLFFYIVSLLLMGATLCLFCFLAAQLDKLILI